MKRNGFTMVELIFVIIIIGILSVAAIPKFGDIRDRAKINSEYSALSGLDSAIQAAIEFHVEDNDGKSDVLWHGQPAATDNDDATNGYNIATTGINDSKKVLSKVVKKGDNLKIVAFSDLNANGANPASGDADEKDMEYDVIFIEGRASNHTTGVVKDTDVPGKPDKNDVWVFNSSPVDIVVSTYDSAQHDKTIESGELALIDVSDTTAVNYVNSSSTTDGDLWITVNNSARTITSY